MLTSIPSAATNAKKMITVTSGCVRKAAVVTSGAGCGSFLQMASLQNHPMLTGVEDG